MNDLLVEELREALAVVESASIPDDLRPVAFASAFWAVRGSNGSPLTGATASSSGGSTFPREASDGTAVDKIAMRLGISTEDFEFVYEFDGKELSLRVPPSRLESVKKEAVKQIIYLVSAGRQASGLEEKTSARDLKAVCDERGKADSNFSRILTDLHGEGLVIGGAGQTKTVRVNADGFERTAGIIQRLRNQSE